MDPYYAPTGFPNAPYAPTGFPNPATVPTPIEITGDGTDYDDEVLSGGSDRSGQGDVITQVVYRVNTPSTPTATGGGNDHDDEVLSGGSGGSGQEDVVTEVIYTAKTPSTTTATGGGNDHDDEVLSGGSGGSGQEDVVTEVIYTAKTPSTTTATGDGNDHDDDVLSGDRGGSGQGDVVTEVIYTAKTPSTTTVDGRSLTVCTVVDGPEPLYFPDDGLCDFVFFDSLGVSPENNDFAVERQSSAVHSFVKQGQAGQRTRYGMSVSFSDAQNFSDAFRTPKGKADYESYWTYSVHDWGFLSMDELQVGARLGKDVISALTTLNEMHEYAMSKNVQWPRTFLGIYQRYEPVCDAISTYIKNIFTPTGIVLLGHLSYSDNTRSDCVIMPPVNLFNPRGQNPGILYGHCMSDAVEAAACLWKRNVRISMSLSVTMQARRYKLKDGIEGEPQFYSDCETGAYEQRITAQEICEKPNSGYSTNINYDDTLQSPITYDHADGFAITFENRVSLREKICDAWATPATPSAADMRLGLAAYDVNYDRRSTKCDPEWINGTWSRLRFLLRLHDFLHRVHPDDSIHEGCVGVS
ncbi:uncharacterized protein [Dermacentor albipictus]|uniref:uncharacterized protein isoform X3 n=1 Tax=Dermacentor albipictus TaxID=60249 RepID=UPI0031FC69A0